jgi:RNA polymerase sigma-70 factor (ECF subfamily)
MPDELAGLVTAARGGDRSAFEALVRATTAETYTLAFRLTGNEEDARDVVQETYLRAYKGIGKFRGDAQFSTWLYRITANCAANQLGRRKRHRHDELLDDAPLEDLVPDHDPSARAEASNLRDRLNEALGELPPTLRSVVVLRDVYDLPHDAIADELGISTSAAKVRLHRARKQLRDRLFRNPGEEVDVHAV